MNLLGPAEDELNDIFELSFDEIFVTDADGMVLRVNSVCEKNYGMPASNLIGAHVKDLEKLGIFYPSATLQVIEKKQPIELFQVTNSGRYLHVRTQPLFCPSPVPHNDVLRRHAASQTPVPHRLSQQI